MDWSNERVLRFLDFYEEEPIIWNASHPNHKNRNDVYDAWKRIQQNMDTVYTVDELKKKKDSLMASFRSNISKVKASIRSGASVDTVYKPNWFAYQRMAKFLMDKDEPRETINSEVAVQLQPESNSSDLVEQSDSASGIENDGIVLRPTTKVSFKPPSNKRKQTAAEEEDMKKKMDAAYSVLQASLRKPSPQKDMCDIYGELVAAKLRRMEERSRQIRMHRMDQIMFEMLMNTTFIPNQYPAGLAVPKNSNQQLATITSPVTSIRSQSSFPQGLQPSPIPSQSPLSQPISPAPSPIEYVSPYNSPNGITNQTLQDVHSDNHISHHVSSEPVPGDFNSYFRL